MNDYEGAPAEILKLAFDAAPSALLLVDREGAIVLANEQATRLFGYAREELIGQSVENLVPPTVRGRHEFLRGRCTKDSAERPMGFGRELHAQRKDGTLLPVEISLSPLQTASGELVLSSIVDITSRRRLESALLDGEERLQMMADAAPVMLWTAGPDNLCNFFNKRWLAFTGCRLEEAVGDCAKSIHPDDLERSIEVRSKAWQERREFQLEYRLRRADGEYRWVLEDGAPRFAPDGTLSGYIGSCTDITDLRRVQEEALARQKLESVGLLAGGIAHDFNNLLGSILADAELALELPHSDCSEQVKRIRAVAIRASEIVRELMIYAGQDKANPQPVDLSLLVEEMLQLLKISITKHATLKTDLASNPPAVLADAAEMRQLVMNLILNASEAIEVGEGEIHITTSRVALSTNAVEKSGLKTSAGDYLRLEVTDSGRGMTAEEQARIFDPFFTTKRSGRGLGLSVVQRIVQRYGGDIRARSLPGRGTQFVVLLPATGETAPLDQLAAAPDAKEYPSGAGGTILMVDDEQGLRLAVSQMLRKRGFLVAEAADGSEALELFRTRSSAIDAIVLDMTLPGVSSREVIAEASRIRPDIKVILTTAYSREIAAPAFVAPQVRGFIRKPYQIGDLVTLLRDVLAASHASDREAVGTF